MCRNQNFKLFELEYQRENVLYVYTRLRLKVSINEWTVKKDTSYRYNKTKNRKNCVHKLILPDFVF